MADLSIYKVDLDTPQPNGRSGESPRAAFTKYNELIDNLGDAASVNLPNGVTELKNSVGIEASTSAAASKIPVADSKGKIDDGWLNTTAMASAVELLSHGKNVLLKDNFGNAHHAYRLPIFTFETLNIANCPFTGPLDCFIRQDGSLRPYVDIPIYKASALNSKAVSLPAREPWVSIDADDARARCEELASNAVMMSFEIRAAIMWIMLSLNFEPTGSTEYGRSHSNAEQFGRRVDGRVPNDRSGSGTTLTGTGPNEWNHDGTEFGIADLVGSVWEWTDGMKMVNGQFIVAEYTGQPEASWAATGVYINAGQFSNTAPSTLNTGNEIWGNVPKAPGYAGNERLQRLMIEPIDCTKTLNGRFYWNLDGERFPFRGGAWNSASFAGAAALDCNNVRSRVAGGGIGFRSAFVS